MNDKCKYIEYCTFSRAGISLDPQIIEDIRKEYCFTEKRIECTRYQLAKDNGIKVIPFTLRPDDVLNEEEERYCKLLNMNH